MFKDPVHGRLHPLVVGVVESSLAALHVETHRYQLHHHPLVQLH
jgi:hypothetical protein